MVALSTKHRSAAVLGVIVAGAWMLVAEASGCGGGSETTLDRRGQGNASGAAGRSDAAGKAGGGGTSGKGGGVSGGSGGAGGDNTSAGAAGDDGAAGEYPYEMVNQTCGNGICEHDQAEECDSGLLDCGACPVCGDGTCQKGETEIV